MLKAATVILMALAIFLSMVVNMALKKENNGRSVIIALIGAFGGAICYGYGYAVKESSLLVAIPRTVLAICGMFVGRWEVANVEDSVLFDNPIIMCFFLTAHFLAFYSLANVVMMKLGSSLLKQVRIRLLRKNHLAIIYGISDETIRFANRLRDGWKKGEPEISILFVPERVGPDLTHVLERNGWAYRADSNATNPNSRFLRSLGVLSSDADRKITLYALSPDESKNRRYAADLLDALQEARIPAENLSLTIYTDNTADVSKMQALKNRYGYTDVNSFEFQTLTARLLTREYPVYNTIDFSPEGLAQNDVDIFIAGFGATGQAVLKSFVRNGQFEGSHFHAAVFAPEIESIAGRFFSVYDELCSTYSIDFNLYDARSTHAADYVREHAETLRYIVACTGDENTDWEIIRTLQAVLGKCSKDILFLICGRGTVTNVGTGNVRDTVSDIWINEILTASVADRAAKAVNASYSGNQGDTPEELWRTCTPFSRDSCRAAADFIRAYCRISGIPEKEAAEGKWELSAEMLENLSRTEHLRWNAFHRSMGWKAMSDEEFEKRAAAYRTQQMSGSRSLIRIAKNDEDKHHACLVTWEELNTLSDKENAVTGKNVDYQQYDRDNVLAVPEMLRAFGF